MSIKQELEKLKTNDIWSMMLFVLYNFQKIPEYSAISELAYVLDQKNMLKLCEYFGGQTIKIPTIDQMEDTLYSMLLYQYVDIEKKPLEEALEILHLEKLKERSVLSYYSVLKTTLSNYNFYPRELI